MPSPFDAQNAAVVRVLVESRRAASLTQDKLATLLGKPQSYVSKVERSERRISVAEFIAWAKAVGLTPADLISRVSE